MRIGYYFFIFEKKKRDRISGKYVDQVLYEFSAIRLISM